jgi:hypothetical protein
MSDPNPYEPPREPESLTIGQSVRRGIGVGAILLLTPPAMVIAVIACCSAERAVPVSIRTAVVFGGPPTVLTALMILAAAIAWPRKNSRNGVRSRVAILLATPVAVLIGWAVGFGLALLVVSVTPGRDDSLTAAAWWTASVLFFICPGVTLLGMLWLAWRAGERIPG